MHRYIFFLSLLHTICIYRFLSPSYDFCTNSKESKQKNIAQRDRSCNYRYEKRNIYNFILSRIYISYSNEQYLVRGVENPMKNFLFVRVFEYEDAKITNDKMEQIRCKKTKNNRLLPQKRSSSQGESAKLNFSKYFYIFSIYKYFLYISVRLIKVGVKLQFLLYTFRTNPPLRRSDASTKRGEA